MGVAVAPMVMQSSAASALLQLDESEVVLQAHALQMLDNLADSFWPEISPFIVKIQELSEDEDFPEAKLAALVAAKILYHLGDLDEALSYALRSGDLFNVTATTEFATTLRAKCIDEYVNLQWETAKADESNEKRQALEAVVERILDDCVKRGEIRESIGVALEARKLDRLEDAVASLTSRKERITALNYCFESAQYRNEVLKRIAKMHIQQEQPDEVATANCLAFVEDAATLGETLKRLATSGDETRELTALQIAFDIYDNDTPRFSDEVSALFPATEDSAEDPAAKRQQETLVRLRNILSGRVPSALTLDFLSNYSKADGYILRKIKSSLDTRSSICHSALIFTNAIMHAGTAIDSFLRDNLEWLALASSWAKFSATACLGVIHARHTASALNVLSPYLSTHGGAQTAYSEGGALYALGLMFAHGDSQNLHRAQSSATGGAAAVTDGSTATEPHDAVYYLFRALQNANGNEVVQHGACLGLGLAAMGTWDGVEDKDIYEELKATLFTDTAVAGEAAGIAMGLVAMGSGSDRALDEMFAYAQETQHEKIIRGLSLGMALICYGREEEAEPIIENMSSSKEPILRYGAMFAVAMAYCGTADNKAIRKLLYTAVTDVSDDVRRAAVICLGFVLFRHPRQVPKIIALSADSCFPHVRYGAAMALGIACAGTGLSTASEILEKLVTDSSDFVRQGALIALAMVYMQHSEVQSPKSAEVRKLLEKIIGDKHEDVMTKFGAVLASGIIDAGGRNSTIALTSRSGHRRMTAIVGMMLFTQYWYWFPMVHFIGLALRPTAMIALNRELKMPNLKVKCSAKPSLFAYPPMGPPEKPKTENRAPVAVLSVTAKAMARENRKEKAKTASSSAPTNDKMDIDIKEKNGAEQDADKADAEAEQAAPKEVEPSWFMVSNPSRVVEDQVKLISWPSDERYQPVKPGVASGFLLVRDTKPDEEESFVELRSLAALPTTPAAQPSSGSPLDASGTGSAHAAGAPAEDEGPEPEPPEPFEYTED